MTRKKSGAVNRSRGAAGGKLEPLSESSEMYLQMIWRLTERGSEASVSDIARAMGHLLSTVSEKIAKLTERGFLRHEWREGVLMTPRGGAQSRLPHYQEAAAA
jgi:DtxR family Mn-dependent transcriptional regulator